MAIDIPTLITKLRSAPQKVGTFDRGDPKPLDEYLPAMTGEERNWLIQDLVFRLRWPGISGPNDHPISATLRVEAADEITSLRQRLENANLVARHEAAISEQLRAEIERLKRTSGEG